MASANFNKIWSSAMRKRSELAIAELKTLIDALHKTKQIDKQIDICRSLIKTYLSKKQKLMFMCSGCLHKH